MLNCVKPGKGAGRMFNEQKEKLRIAATGRKLTNEDKKKISESSKKMWETPEIREKLLLSLCKSKNKGNLFSEETRQKMRDSHKNKKRIYTEESRFKISQALKGKKRTSIGYQPYKYTIELENGNITTTINIAEFCRNNKISFVSLNNTFKRFYPNGTPCKKIKGFSLIKKELR